MTNYTTNLMESNLKNLRQSMTNISLDEFIISTLEGLMQIERKEYLEKIESSTEKGNGYYNRAFRSLRRNAMTINVPRTRNGDFSPATLELLKKNREDVDDLCLLLTRKGMTTRDIADVLEDFFQETKSHTSINNMAKEFHKMRIAWNNSALESNYRAIFCDVMFITVRREDSYSKEGVYIAYGIRSDGKRELIALEVYPTESATSWKEILEQAKRRGLETTEIVIADGIIGMEGVVHELFPEAKFQKCVVHKEREILRKTRPKDKEEIATDLKHLFDNFDQSATTENALNKLNIFCNKWRNKYKNIDNYFNEGVREYYFTYIQFPIEIRRMIYTTNSIENLNRIVRKATKNKLSFESPETLIDYVFIVIKDFEDRNWMKYPVTAFKKILI